MPERALGFGGSKDYSPTLLANEDPKMVLARSGGAPLLANIAMGVNVDDALAGYFGKNKGEDFQQWYASLDGAGQSALDSVRAQLTQVQSNTELRNQAVQKVVDDFPNIAANAAKSRQAAGGEFDEATKGAMDLALSSVASKYAAGGALSSGAALAAEARTGAQMGKEKLDYMDSREGTAYDKGLDDWRARYAEVNALRGFQQKMLGMGVQEGFSANRDALNRDADIKRFNTGAVNDAAKAKQASDDAMFGAIGNLAGTAAMYAIAGPGGSMAAKAMKPPQVAQAPAPNYANTGFSDWG
jgi:hypothetical protein